MHKPVITAGFAMLALFAAAADDELLEFHEDYYLGFSQGAYYGLMLAGVDYAIAWCMKSELDYEGAAMGTGGEFQAKLEQLLAECRERHAGED